MANSTLTPHAMLASPRPSSAVVSPSGLRFAQVASSFDFRTRRTTRHVYVTEIATKATKIAIHGLRYPEVVWLDDQTLLYLKRGAPIDESLTDQQQKQVWAKEDATDLQLIAKDIDSLQETLVGSLPIDAIGDLKIHHISASAAVLVFSASVYAPERTVYTARQRAREIEEELQGSNVRVYDSLFVRHWDSWVDKSVKQPQVVFLKKVPALDDVASNVPPSSPSLESVHSLSSEEEESTASAASWVFDGEVISPLAQTQLECPVGPFGSSADYDINATHLVFTAKPATLPPAWHTRQHISIVPLYPRNATEAVPRVLTRQVGATSGPVFSPSYKHAGPPTKGSVAWLEMREDGYESDRNRVMLHDFDNDKTEGLTEDWDRSPSEIVWAQDGATLFLNTEDLARSKLFALDLKSKGTPKLLKVLERGSITAVSVLPTPTTQNAPPELKPNPTRLLVTHNSVTHPNRISLWDDQEKKLTLLSDLAATDLKDIVPSLDPGEEFWFKGAYPEQDVHGWIIRPPNFPKQRDAATLAKEEKKWPLAFLIHGGPQGSWTDSWSTRWNPSVWASQGYIVVLIDPTGSTGYGQKFCDSIKGEWGGLPQQDLVAGYHCVLKKFKEIDPERTVAAGASYGGYSINWIQGHNPGFKALICHDGVFSTTQVWYSTEELYFAERENNYTTPYNGRENYEKWSPERFVKNWATPQLIIHGGRDYRLPEVEGLGVFTTLQRLGIPSRFVYFETENHWVLDPLNSAQWHHEVFKFAREWVGNGREDKTHAGYGVQHANAA